MKTKISCRCQVCGEQFKNNTDHMLHYMRTHDDGYKERHQRRKRVHCRQCLVELLTDVFECDTCGWKL